MTSSKWLDLPLLVAASSLALGCEIVAGYDRARPERREEPDTGLICAEPSAASGTADDPFLIGYAASPPRVGFGASDPEWCQAPEYQLLTTVDGEALPDAASFAATVRLLWDDDALYVLFSVKDDTRTESFFSYDADHARLHFGLAEPRPSTTSRDNPSFVVLNMPANADSIGAPETAPEVDEAAINLITEELTDGWRLELEIPWSALEGSSLPIVDGALLALDVGVGDRDTDDGPVTELRLFSSEPEVSKRPPEWGTAQLVPRP